MLMPRFRKNCHSFARRCVHSATSRSTMIKTIGNILQKVFAALCSHKVNSLLLSKSKEFLENFTVNALIKEIKPRTPSLFSVLQSCLKVDSENLKIAEITANICKHRRSRSSLFKPLVSLVIYASQSAKHVRFNGHVAIETQIYYSTLTTLRFTSVCRKLAFAFLILPLSDRWRS